MKKTIFGLLFSTSLFASSLSSLGGGSAVWGGITGTLSSQTDLQTALNLKAPLASPVFTGTIGTPLSINNIVATDGSGNLTVFGATSSVVTLTGSQTLTNKTLTAPVIGTISNTGTLTLPTSTDTLVGRTTVDTLANKTLSSATISGTLTAGSYHLEPCVNDNGNSGTSQTINLATCAIQKSTLTGNVTYTFSNPVQGGTYVLEVATGAGGFAITWPGTVKWPSGSAPIVTAAGSKTDLYNFYYDGTNFYGSFSQNY